MKVSIADDGRVPVRMVSNCLAKLGSETAPLALVAIRPRMALPAPFSSVRRSSPEDRNHSPPAMGHSLGLTP